MTERAGSILICGAGPVGLSLALELARRGIAARVIDKASGPAPLHESRALAVNARTLALLEPSGATGQILQEALQVEYAEFTFEGSTRVRLEPNAHPDAGHGLHMLAQGRVERILLAELQRHGVEPEWATAITAVETKDGRAHATIATDTGSEGVAADLLVGADGAHSIVRKRGGFDFEGESLPQTFYLADLRYSRALGPVRVRARFLSPGVLAAIPVSRMVMRFVSTLADWRRRLDPGERDGETLWQSEFRVSFRNVARMQRGPIFLAGDAAHIHSPVGGRGMNLGIEDACWLAWLIDQGREAEYSTLRMPAVRHVIRQTRLLTRAIVASRSWTVALRDLGIPLALKLPPVRDRLLRGVLGLDTPPPPWLPRPPRPGAT
jgi:2-polyprenyl-6-methoxyphenol hydroxylase-like FAD-dependent oxidoreductase